MSVFDQKYRKYDGEFKGRFSKIWAIAVSTFKVQFRGRKLYFLLPICNILPLSFTLMLVFMAVFVPDIISQVFFQNFGGLKLSVYTIINFSFGGNVFSSFMIFLPLVFVAIFGAGVIANDKKHNALALYMSKPIDRIDYAFGKTLAVFMLNTFITIVPWYMFMLAFTMLTSSAAIDPMETIETYFAVLGAALVIIFFLSSVVLLFSSMTDNRILAGIGIILVTIIPSILGSSISSVPGLGLDWVGYFSFSVLASTTVYYIFGQPGKGSFFNEIVVADINGWVSMAILLIVGLLSLLIAYLRLSKEEIN